MVMGGIDWSRDWSNSETHHAGKDPGGFIITGVLGIAGSVIATWVGRAVGWYAEGQSAGFIMSVLGAIALLAIYHIARRKPA